MKLGIHSKSFDTFSRFFMSTFIMYDDYVRVLDVGGSHDSTLSFFIVRKLYWKTSQEVHFHKHILESVSM